MRTIFLLFGCAIVTCSLVWACSGPSDAEVSASQNAQCLNWGATWGSAEYISCRATLATNYHREQQDNSNANVAGAAMVMGGMAAANSGVRK